MHPGSRGLGPASGFSHVRRRGRGDLSVSRCRLAATLIAALPLGLRGRPTWWAPAIGIVLTVLLSVGTTFAMHVATSAG